MDAVVSTATVGSVAGVDAVLHSGMRTGLARAGWIVLIVLNTGMLLNHLVAIFLVATSADEGRMFIAYAVVNALALLVLFFPYRARQRWAWASIWLVALATAVTIA
jgi:hypothetical protein